MEPYSALARLAVVFFICKIIAPLTALALVVSVMASNSIAQRGAAALSPTALLQIGIYIVSAILAYFAFDGLADACRALNELVYAQRARLALNGLCEPPTPPEANPSAPAPIQPAAPTSAA